MKIGIVTLYYKNRNYGANLQAYALEKVLSDMGNEVELISYYNNTFIHKILSDIKSLFTRDRKIKKYVKIRNKSVDSFNDNMKHSKLYLINSINKANNIYDAFVVGSDQVWNPDWINRALSLEFVKNDKLKIAYAASCGRINFSDNQKEVMKNVIARTNYISIREKETIPNLIELSNKPIYNVLDPTLLLDSKEWDEICSNRIIKENYIFCYFLGGNENLRKVSDELAKIKKLKIVSFPFLNSKYRQCDDRFGDYQIYDATPNDFISLIKHSSFVITDSFHGAVFSHIYKKNFVVSSSKDNEMGCRMSSLTELFGTKTRYYNEHNSLNIDILSNAFDENITFNETDFLKLKKESYEFLKKSLINE